MAVIDALLLRVGVGGSAAGSMAHFHGPVLDRASVGPATMDYPDMVLAAVLGGAVAGTPMQRRAAVTLAVLAGVWGMLLAVLPIVPATVPVALTALRLEGGRLRGRLRSQLPACAHRDWRRCAACAA
jgi:hypothetical protein